MGLFANYQRALEPVRLLDVVPDWLLLSLMDSFHYRNHAGMVLIFESGTIDTKGDSILETLYPGLPGEQGKGTKQEYFNRFCAAYRQETACEQNCEACDRGRARFVFKQGATAKPGRYPCHMGLTDITIPLFIGDRVVAVLYAGQKIVKNTNQADKVRAAVAEKVPAGERQNELTRLVAQVEEEAADVDRFEKDFHRLGETMQLTINAQYERRCAEEMEKAVSVVHTVLTGTFPDPVTTLDSDDGKHDWRKVSVPQVHEVVRELSEFLSVSPIWLLMRFGSVYRTISHAPDTKSDDFLAFPVSTVAALPQNQWVEVVESGTTAQVARAIIARTHWAAPFGRFLRVDILGPASQAMSVIMFTRCRLSDKQGSFVAQCLRAIAYPAQVGHLFAKLGKQNKDTALRMAFIGHHLKTPFQSIFLKTFRLSRFNQLTPEGLVEVNEIARQITSKAREALADALILQTALMESKEIIDVVEISKLLLADLSEREKARGITIAIRISPTARFKVRASLPRLRIALSALFDNAVKYSHEKKTVKVSFAPILQMNFESNTLEQRLIEICIENCGQGFDEETRERLFGVGVKAARDEQGKPASFGLGLAQAKEFIEECGGTIDIQSHPTSGKDNPHITTVTLTLLLD